MTSTNKIVKARKKLGLTQIEVAVMCDVSVAAYRLWEKGGSKPSAQNEKKLRKVLELEVDHEPTIK